MRFAALALLTLFPAVAAASVHCDGTRELCRVVPAAEAAFASMLATGDPAPFATHLAPDAVYVTADGAHHTKADMIALVRAAPPHASARLEQLRVRQYGATAIATWTESWTDPGRSPDHGTISGMDTWVRRAGRWRVVATREART